MKSIAGSIVVLGGCVLLGVVTAAPKFGGGGNTYSSDLHDFAAFLGVAVIAIGLFLTYRGYRESK